MPSPARAVKLPSGRRWLPWMAGSAFMLLVVTTSAFAGTHARFQATTYNTGNLFTAAADFGGCDLTTVVADADTYVNNGAKTTNYGSLTSTRSAGGADQHRALIHFTLPDLGACTLSGATLKLQGSTGSTDGIVRNVQAIRAAAAWTETTVTWNTQPATTGTATAAVAATGPVAFDVTTAVSDMYAGTSGDTSFLVRYETETGGGGHRWFTTWNSRESSTNKPVLELTLS